MTQRGDGSSSGEQTQTEQADPAATGQDDAALLGESATEAVAESTAAEAAPPAPASVSVTGMLPSGLVIVDGVAQSSQDFELSSGIPHIIVMRQAGYETVTDTVTFEAGQRVRYPYVGRSTARPAQTETPTQRPTQRPAPPRTGVIQIRVRPWANVFIGNQEFAETSRVVDTLTAGPHTIRFRRDGFIPKDTIVTVPPGETVTIQVRLQGGD